MGNLTKSSVISSMVGWLIDRFTKRKVHTFLSVALVLAWGVAIAYAASKIDQSLPAILLLVATGIVILIICLKNPLSGLYFTSLFSAFFALPGRLFNIQSPIGILVELFTYVLLLAVLRIPALKKENTAGFWNNGISISLMVILIYYVIELANLANYSKLGWLFFLRKQISYLLFYFISYMVLNSYSRIKFFLKFWILLVLLIALYGIKQQVLGLANFEELWLQSSPVLMQLYFQTGFLRKFSLLTDPAAFGIICAAFSLLTLVLAIRLPDVKIKIAFYLSTATFLVACAFSGTRTCNLMIAAGLLAYIVFTLNEKRTYLLIIASFFIIILLLLGPLKNNPVVYRIKTTLNGSKEASALVRDNNRRAIQPYIYSHPMGGGLNTSGVEGQLYSPAHPLASFPPDSGYLKILLEQGWIGFLLHLVFYFVLLKRGVDCYFKARNANIKTMYIAITICLFSVIVGQYSQIAISQYPLILFYFSSLAILTKLIDYDTPVAEQMAVRKTGLKTIFHE